MTGDNIMLRMIIRRVLQVIPILFIVVTITFVLTRMIPGDPASMLAGPQATAETIEKIREEYGLNDSMWKQYLDYLVNLLHGDFGTSMAYGTKVTKTVGDKLPNTLVLAFTSLVFAIILGIGIGMVSAIKQYSLFDYIFMLIALIGVSVPIFWLGLMLVLKFSVQLAWLPVTGMGSFQKGIWDVISHMILPCVCLVCIPCATFARITRSSMLEVIHSDYIKSMKARGIKQSKIILKHAFKNALPPIITVLGMQIAGSFMGAILTESIFAWPGMGTMILNSINNRDYAVIQGVVVMAAGIFVIINMLVDIVFILIDPRVDYSGEGGH